MNKTLMVGYSGNIAYPPGPINDIVETDKNHLYFNGGLVAEFPLNKQKNRFSIESGLILKTIGEDVSVTFTRSWSPSGHAYYAESFSTKLWYLSIPAYGRISFAAGKRSISYILGPYFNLGIGGNENGAHIDWGNSKFDDFRRLDIGLATGLALSGKKSEAGILCSSSTRDIDPSWNSIYNRELSFYLRFNLHHKIKPNIKHDQELQPTPY